MCCRPKAKGRKSIAWSRTGVMALIRSRVYRGELWDGDELVCKNAHKPIVTESQWRFAQRGSRCHPYQGRLDRGTGPPRLDRLLRWLRKQTVPDRIDQQASASGSRATSAASTTPQAATAPHPQSPPRAPSTRTWKTLLLQALGDPDSHPIKAHEIGARIQQAADRVRDGRGRTRHVPCRPARLGARLRPVPRRSRAPPGRSSKPHSSRRAKPSPQISRSARPDLVPPGSSSRLALDGHQREARRRPRLHRARHLTKADPKRRRWQPIGRTSADRLGAPPPHRWARAAY